MSKASYPGKCDKALLSVITLSQKKRVFCVFSTVQVFLFWKFNNSFRNVWFIQINIFNRGNDGSDPLIWKWPWFFPGFSVTSLTGRDCERKYFTWYQIPPFRLLNCYKSTNLILKSLLSHYFYLDEISYPERWIW